MRSMTVPTNYSDSIRLSAFRALLPLMLLAACGSTETDASNGAGTAACTRQTTATAVPQAFKVGVNVTTINNWDGNRPFLNMIYGTTWRMTSAAGGYEDVPSSLLDANGWVKSLPAGYQVVRNLSVPV